jgi:hypothetical protein
MTSTSASGSATAFWSELPPLVVETKTTSGPKICRSDQEVSDSDGLAVFTRIATRGASSSWVVAGSGPTPRSKSMPAAAPAAFRAATVAAPGGGPLPLEVAVQRRQALLHLGRGAHGAEGVILVNPRDPEDGPHLVEVALHDAPQRLRVEPLAEPGPPADVGEHDADGLPRLLQSRAWSHGHSLLPELGYTAASNREAVVRGLCRVWGTR